MSFENAFYQWQQGERRLRAAPKERVARLERVTELIVADLRRRLGGRFTAQELVELYGRGTGWCLQISMRAAPETPGRGRRGWWWMRPSPDTCARHRISPAARGR